MRIRLTVRYDGTAFAGSQRQPGRRTVAGTLTDELESLLGQPVRLVFASRTDSGVHADGNVCAFDAQPVFPVARLAAILNRRLPEDLRVREASEAEARFHPRFDAMGREYVYRVYRSADVPVDRLRYVAPYSGPWDAAAVAQGLKLLAGEQRFAAFSRFAPDKHEAVCTLQPVIAEERGPEISWRFAADRFLWNMVCRLAGALLGLAEGQVSLRQIEAALAGTRDFKLKPAPAKGLTLVAVRYERH
jgi:tRNA pseudouridine38-40 synthase